MVGAVREVQGPWRAAPLIGPRRELATRTRWVIGAIAAIVAIDQLTKVWAVAALSDGPKHVIGDTVEFELTRNGGSAFSRFQGMTPILAVGAIVVTIVLARVLRRTTDRWLVVALTLVLGGALGNLVDRFFRGRRASCAATSSTSSRSGGGRCSTSPTRASRSARCC